MQDAFKLTRPRERGTDMARRLLTKLTRAMTAQWPSEEVHFHGGANGAYVCDDPRCVSPHLDIDNAWRPKDRPEGPSTSAGTASHTLREPAMSSPRSCRRRGDDRFRE